MSRPHRSAPLAAVLALALAAMACGRGPGPASATATATALAPITSIAPATPTLESGGIAAGSVEVRSTTTYVDSFNYFHLVGEIFNGTEGAVTGIELMAHVADASGQSALDGDDRPIDGEIFSPLLYTLAPGESAPFDFFRILPDGADMAGWQASVTVASQAPAELARVALQVEHTRTAANDSGSFFLTGELVNTAATPVKISSFAGALLADDGRVMAASATTDFSGILAAAGDPGGGDRTPFVIAIDGPAEAGTQAAYYVDAAASEPQTIANDVTIRVANRFADEFDDLHLAASVTNNGAEMLTIRLVAGLYAADGTVLDSASATTPIYAAPGATVPVTFDYFNSLNRRVDEQAQVDRVSVQIDPQWTYAIPYPVAMLQTAEEVKEPVGPAQYSFRGDVVNNTNADLTSATLILAIFDGSNQLVVSNWTNVYPETETFKPGETLPFDMSVYLPLGADVSTYSFTTIVQGYVKE
jgi:hypothetical protein